MANFAAYQSRGQLAAPQEHFTKPVGLSYDNPGERALAREGANMAGVFIKGYENWKEQYDSGKVMEANNEYNRLMSEGTAELMQKKQENALNIVQDYDKLHQKALDQVRKKFGAFINYGKAGQAFNIYTERDNNTRRNNMMKYQIAETEAYHETQFNNQLTSCMEIVASGGYSDLAIESGINRALPLIQDRYKNYGKEMIQNQTMAAKRGIVESALAFASSMSDYARMQDICNKYKDAISPAKMSATLAAIGKRQQEAQTLAFNDRMWADLGPGATPEQVDEWIEKNYQGKHNQGQNARGHNLPLFKQWDDNWADRPFSNGTLGTSGCAPTSMAMALSWAVGKYISPVEVADYATNNGLVASDGVHGADFVPAVAEHYGVEMRQTSDKEEVINLLQKGIPVVAAHDPGMFTDYGHFLVYSGIDANGRVMINDPNGGVRHSDDATFSLDEIFNQESADYYVIDSAPQSDGVGAVYDENFYRMDLEEAKQKGRADYNHRYNAYKATENITIGKAQDEMWDLMNQGIDDIEQYKAIVDKYAYNDHTRIAMEKTVSAIERRNEKAAEQGARRQPSEKVNETDMELVRDEISTGRADETAITNYCAQRGITSTTEINKLMKLYKDYKNNKGEWAIPYDDIKAYCDIDERMIEDKKSFNKTFKRIARFQYYKMLADNKGQLFSGWEEDLADRVAKAFTEEYHGGQYVDKGTWMNTEENVILPYRILAANGYDTIRQTGDDGYVLESADGKYAYMSGEDIMKMKDLSGYRR